jgi:hypothetical protein
MGDDNIDAQIANLKGQISMAGGSIERPETKTIFDHAGNDQLHG